jgi:hypothetical protein
VYYAALRASIKANLLVVAALQRVLIALLQLLKRLVDFLENASNTCVSKSHVTVCIKRAAAASAN